jgi:SP family myo-inositol transporter-like MFS transporter 13
MTDAAAEPLIADSRDYPNDEDDVEDVEVDESALVAPGSFIWGLTICAGVSGLLFGYDTGVISSTLISIGTSLSARPLTTLDKSLITSSTSFFALLASPLTGILADALGRRGIILIADVLFVAGAVIQAFSTTVWGMIIGRSVVGAAVGSASFVVPMYISELAPSAFRGRMVTVSSLFITGGQVVAYIIGWLFSTRPNGWRWMVGLGALPAAVQFCMMFVLPETPRYLVKVGRKEQARQVLRKVYGLGEGMEKMVNGVLRKVEKEILEEEDAANERNIPQTSKTSWNSKMARVNDNFTQLVSVGGNRRALIIACMLQGFQQLCGFVSALLPIHPRAHLSHPKKRVMLILGDSELPDVLLRHNLPPRGLPKPHLNIPLHRPNKLPLHPDRLPLYRPHWAPAYPPVLCTCHGRWPSPVFRGVLIC